MAQAAARATTHATPTRAPARDDAHRILVRVGIPEPGGSLVAAAHAAGHPVLFSANAFSRGFDERGCFRGFRLPASLAGLAGQLDAALDSAGFVAASKYGEFPWTTPAYYDLVEAFPWTWHAARDYCVEPEIAHNATERRLRIAATAAGLAECRREAARRSLPMPTPVLQGWTADDYKLCADELGLIEWPELVGVGSVCRRQVGGVDGLIAIVDALDAILPAHVRLHLFGVKSAALAKLAGHARIASMDSMAWDFAARQKALREGTPYRMDARIEQMNAWAPKQRAAARAQPDWGFQMGLLAEAEPRPEPTCPLQWLTEQLAVFNAEVIADEQLEYGAIRMRMPHEHWALGQLWYAHGVQPFIEEGEYVDAIDDVLIGFREWLQMRADWCARRQWLESFLPDEREPALRLAA